MAHAAGMQCYAARLESFQQPYQIAKRRASSQKKGKQSVEWPHESPSDTDLARAGFFYRPGQDSLDNVQCFLCAVKLDGWEPSDDALTEHLNHSSTCAWATCLSVERNADEAPEMRDPMRDDMRNARKQTFTAALENGSGISWPHEAKRGWRCKVDKMVDAGWCFDPAQGAEDGVICFYCNCSLDGWEPKDDPYQEHMQRSADCRFFELLQQYQTSASTGTKAKVKVKGPGRASSASRGSRVSNVSVMSEATGVSIIEGSRDEHNLLDEEDRTAGVDDSITTTGTVGSQTDAQGSKKGTRGKPAAKGAKGRKKMNKLAESTNMDVLPPQVPEDAIQRQQQPDSKPVKATRKRAQRGSKQVEFSMMDASTISEIPTKKSTRGRNLKAQTEEDLEAESDVSDNIDVSVSAQLQEELEQSIAKEHQAADARDEPDVEPLPTMKTSKSVKGGRGVKRTSDGIAKVQEPDHSTSIVTVEFPMPPKPKAKQGRPRKSDESSNLESSMVVSLNMADEEAGQADSQPANEFELAGHVDGATTKKTRGRPKKSSVASVSSQVQEKVVKPKKAPPTRKRTAKGKRTASARSSRTTDTSDASRTEGDDRPEDLDQDEREIEAELERIAAEQTIASTLPAAAKTDVQVAENHEKPEEWEPTPSNRVSKHADFEIAASSPWQEAETSTPRMQQQTVANTVLEKKLTPSPASSDKENQPSSLSHAPATSTNFVGAAAIPTLSPSKQVRVALAPGTPNARMSPSRTGLMLSPSKQFRQLSSTAPWTSIDLDSIFLTSAEPSPGKIGVALAQVAGKLTEHEQAMTVEEWINWRAEEGERDLRRRCEERVALFEKEGLRAMAALEGIEVLG